MKSLASRASDHALLGGFAAGDADASAAFVRLFQSRVYGVAMNLLGERCAAEGVALEAFVQARKHASAYDPARGSVAVWLMRTTRSLALDSRHRRPPRTLHRDLSDAVLPFSTAPLADNVGIPDGTARIRAAFGHLPPEQAMAVWLAAFHGHTARQIAAFERIPVDTAKARIQQGMHTLRTALSDSDSAAPMVEPAPSHDLQGDPA